ncbi:zinc ribbon domain-containing protein [Fervidobacterium sp.]
MYCRNCGKPIPNDSKFCPYCGHELSKEVVVTDFGAYRGWIYFLLALLLGILGIHRLYVKDRLGAAGYFVATVIALLFRMIMPVVIIWLIALFDGFFHIDDKALYKAFKDKW